MPIFEYYCDRCGVFETIITLNETGDRIFCPNCRSESQRLFSPPSFYRPFSGIRHKVLHRVEKGREPQVVRKGEKHPLEAALPGSKPHKHIHHGGGLGSPGYAPWMIKH